MCCTSQKKPGVQGWLLDFLMKPLRKLRIKLINQAEGQVLEIGVGTGLNFELYTEKVEKVVGIEPDTKLLPRAHKRAEEINIPVEIHTIGAENMPFEDDSFDTIVVTWVLCTIPDVEGALAEMKRVLKPGGKLLWIEHTRSRHGLIRRIQDLFNPLWKPLAGGCHLNREPLEFLEQAGFVTSGHRARTSERWNLLPIYQGISQEPQAGEEDGMGNSGRLL